MLERRILQLRTGRFSSLLPLVYEVVDFHVDPEPVGPTSLRPQMEARSSGWGGCVLPAGGTRGSARRETLLSDGVYAPSISVPGDSKHTIGMKNTLKITRDSN